MENKRSNMSGWTATERAFLVRVTVVSLILLAMLMGIFALAWYNRDTIFVSLATAQAGRGSFEKAVKTAEKIGDEETRLRSRYDIASAMYDSGLFADASGSFVALGEYEDSGDRKLMCDYALAEQLYQSGDYAAALTAFAALGAYSDSVQRQQQTIYQMAAQANTEGDTATAISLYLSVEDYADSYDRAYEIALALTSDPDMAVTMLESGGQTPEAMEKVLKIAERRGLMANVMIGAGAGHTVVLYPDGTVDACGDDTYGQCQVGQWKDIVQIAVGPWHTVGLQTDGTVVATGKNDHGQCDVAHLTDITQIAAGDSDTYGLDENGKVHSCGFHAYDSIARAADVRSIYAGSYAAAAQTANGTVVTSHPSFSMMPRGQILDLGIQTGYHLVHYLDGTLTSSWEIGGDWEDIVCFGAGPNAIVAADLQGKVRTHFFRESGAVDTSELEGICQCAAGTGHYVFLTESGQLIALGDNTHGQCDITTLRPLPSPAEGEEG